MKLDPESDRYASWLVYGFWFRVLDLGFWAEGLGLRVLDLGFRA